MGGLFYNLNNRHCENSLMIFIELHMHSNSKHAHILHAIVSPINVETMHIFCAKVCYFAAKIKKY